MGWSKAGDGPAGQLERIHIRFIIIIIIIIIIIMVIFTVHPYIDHAVPE